jgi:hypothetical protein
MNDLATAILDRPSARQSHETAGRDERMLPLKVEQKDKKKKGRKMLWFQN